jgi:hypothetical protein
MPRQWHADATILIQPQRTQVSDLQAITPDSGDVSSLVRARSTPPLPSMATGAVKALTCVAAKFRPRGDFKDQGSGSEDFVAANRLRAVSADAMMQTIAADILSGSSASLTRPAPACSASRLPRWIRC